ncbi:hypothetical protein AtNW77_Chr3g0195171 [Arabidopsis thaliana]
MVQFYFETGPLRVWYLGLPLLTKHMSLADCLPLLEQIRAHISYWKNRFLSYAGRLQLLSSKAKVAWEDVCRPKKEGGLGLKSFIEANRVCCFKLVWRITSASSLWVDWIKRGLLWNGSFWSIKHNAQSGS